MMKTRLLPSRTIDRLTAALGVAFACSATAVMAAPVHHYEGTAYAAANGRLLYRESHWLYEDGGSRARVVLYRCPDGTPFARKRVHDVPNAQAPDFEMVDARNGYLEGVRSKGESREVFTRAGKEAPERKASLRTTADTVIDAGFDAFVRSHWQALDAGAPVSLSFVVPSRLEALGFEVRRIDGKAGDAKGTRRFRLELASWYGGLLPHIDVDYDAATHALRRYEGVSNVRDANGRNVNVRIEFPAGSEAKAATDADVAEAVAAPLTGTCPLS